MNNETYLQESESLQEKGTLILGQVFLILGILGMIASALSSSSLFGVWEVSLPQSLIHFVLGLLAFYSALSGEHKSRTFLGLLTALLGFATVSSLFFYAQGVVEVGGIILGARTFMVYSVLLVIAVTYSRIKEEAEYRSYWQTLNSSTR